MNLTDGATSPRGQEELSLLSEVLVDVLLGAKVCGQGLGINSEGVLVFVVIPPLLEELWYWSTLHDATEWLE